MGKTSVNVILLGAQGAGKGTQAEKLSQTFKICHISSGDLFRENIAGNTDLGLKVKEYLETGSFVPDDITIALVGKRVMQPDCSSGMILDGFPRTVSQAQALDQKMLEMQRTIDLAIYLQVPYEELLRRISGRYICRAHQHIYNIYTCPPKHPGICDIDGSELYQRPDDKGNVVQKRLALFFQEIIYLLDYYRDQQKLVIVDGCQNIDQVYKSLIRLLRSFNS